TPRQDSGICEIAVNASLAFIEGTKPQGEVECALAIQMACTHTAAMAVLNRLGGGHGPTEALRRWRPQRPDCYAPIQPKRQHYAKEIQIIPPPSGCIICQKREPRPMRKGRGLGNPYVSTVR